MRRAEQILCGGESDNPGERPAEWTRAGCAGIRRKLGVTPPPPGPKRPAQRTPVIALEDLTLPPGADPNDPRWAGLLRRREIDRRPSSVIPQLQLGLVPVQLRFGQTGLQVFVVTSDDDTSPEAEAESPQAHRTAANDAIINITLPGQPLTASHMRVASQRSLLTHASLSALRSLSQPE